MRLVAAAAPMLLSRTYLICLALALTLGGCGRRPSDPELKRIAKNFLIARFPLPDNTTYQVKRESDGETWTVTVTSPIPSPEGKTKYFVEIDQRGNVVSFL